MKRKTKFIIFTGILSVISLAGCLVDEELSQKVENKDILDITVEETKEYFESSVRTFHLSPPRTTRMVNDELLSTPMWEKAVVLDLEERRVVEIPVDAPFANICKRDNLKDSISTKKGFINTIVRLVAEKDADDKILFTIVRITGNNKYILRHRKKFFRMKTNSVDEFSGMIKYYTLQGELISGKKYESGNVVATISPVDVASPKVQTRAMEEQCDFVYYQVDDYYCQDVYVGGELLSQSCELVDSWTEAVWECQMVEVPDQEICPNCGQNPCVCEDSEVDSGGVGSQDSTSQSKRPIQLTNKSNFVGWVAGSNCLTLCKEILRKYGQTNVGSSQYVYQLTIETDELPRMKHWAKDPITVYENAIECIDRHLNDSKVIIVGIDHSEGKSNIDGTDHFVVITGRGFDDSRQQYYYTFMDTGTANVDVGCSDLNRLYYRSEVPWLSGSSQAINNGNIEITVTHIRPNDGHYENTVNEQQSLQK